MRKQITLGSRYNRSACYRNISNTVSVIPRKRNSDIYCRQSFSTSVDNVDADGSQSPQAGLPQGDKTSFGFQTVRTEEKEDMVGHVFDSVASSYDIMNDLMSGGLHRFWKDDFVKSLRPLYLPPEHRSSNVTSPDRNPVRVLDVAGGTGDIAFRVLEAMRPPKSLAEELSGSMTAAASVASKGLTGLSEAVGQTSNSETTGISTSAATGDKMEGQRETDTMENVDSHSDNQTPEAFVTICDINESMLREGQHREVAQGAKPGELAWVHGSAEALPFASGSFDVVTIAFGIRNVTDIPKALREAHRVLKPGGRFSVLEFSQVSLPFLREAYDLYSLNVIPALGQAVTGDGDSYRYLVESIRRFPPQEQFQNMIADAGFGDTARYRNLTGGIVAVHDGFKL